MLILILIPTTLFTRVRLNVIRHCEKNQGIDRKKSFVPQPEKGISPGDLSCNFFVCLLIKKLA